MLSNDRIQTRIRSLALDYETIHLHFSVPYGWYTCIWADSFIKGLENDK